MSTAGGGDAWKKKGLVAAGCPPAGPLVADGGGMLHIPLATPTTATSAGATPGGGGGGGGLGVAMVSVGWARLSPGPPPFSGEPNGVEWSYHAGRWNDVGSS